MITNSPRVLAFKFFRLHDEVAGKALFRELFFERHRELISQYSDGIIDRLFDHFQECWLEDKNEFRKQVRERDFGLPSEVIFPAWEIGQEARSLYLKYGDSFGKVEEYLLIHGGLKGIATHILSKSSEWIGKGITYGALIFFATAIGLPIYQDWSKERDRARLEEEKKSVSTQASLAGIQIAQAFKACVRIGISDVQQCARYDGQLIQEMVAPIAAKNALNSKDEYIKTCLRFYPEDYCSSLLNRSISLSMNTAE